MAEMEDYDYVVEGKRRTLIRKTFMNEFVIIMVFVHVYTFLIINKTIRNVAANGWWLLRVPMDGRHKMVNPSLT